MTQCAVPDCPAPATKRGWCGKHYQRWWKHGDPTVEPTTFTQCQMAPCVNRPRSARSELCEMHYYRKRRHGDPTVIINTRRPDAKYRAAHQRVARDRGPAATHGCVDCGSPAHHWSYSHTDPDALHSPGGQPYSLDPRHYEPRCASCHDAFDHAR